jgi:hypothetical protein
VTVAELRQGWRRVASPVGRSFRDLLPIVAVVGAFQVLVFQQPLENLAELLLGLGLVVAGLTLLVFGLQEGLIPVGEAMAHELARRGSLPWLVAFAFALGFGTSFAEPALIAIAGKAGELTAAAADPVGQVAGRHGLALRFTVALGVGVALSIGVLRIVLGLPLQPLILVGYALVLALTPLAPADAVALAYDSGGFTLTTLSVPLAAAVGVGLASSIRGRRPLVDGFGLVALGSLTPILFVLVLRTLSP